MTELRANLTWVAVACLGAFSFGVIALARGETINAFWLVSAAVCVYLLAYRFYSLFIAERVLRLDPQRNRFTTHSAIQDPSSVRSIMPADVT